MIISKVILLLAMFVPDLLTVIHNTAFYHKNEFLSQTIHNRCYYLICSGSPAPRALQVLI